MIQTIGLGPHRMTPKTRPAWFFEKERYGGILTDIASHQFDQFLFFTGSSQADVIASQVGNVAHPQWPGLEDFGDAMVRGNGGSGYVRVDWFTPDGLSTWGDGRLTILGTEGFIEIRKNVDIGGRPGGNHLFLVDQKETRYVDCKDVALPYGERLVDDVLNRTETAMPQAHCFLAMELALRAEKQAQPVGSASDLGGEEAGRPRVSWWRPSSCGAAPEPPARTVSSTSSMSVTNTLRPCSSKSMVVRCASLRTVTPGPNCWWRSHCPTAKDLLTGFSCSAARRDGMAGTMCARGRSPGALFGGTRCG